MRFIYDNFRERWRCEPYITKSIIKLEVNNYRKANGRDELKMDQEKAIEAFLRNEKLVDKSGKRWSLTVRNNCQLEHRMLNEGLQPYGRNDSNGLKMPGKSRASANSQKILMNSINELKKIIDQDHELIVEQNKKIEKLLTAQQRMFKFMIDKNVI